MLKFESMHCLLTVILSGYINRYKFISLFQSPRNSPALSHAVWNCQQSYYFKTQINFEITTKLVITDRIRHDTKWEIWSGLNYECEMNNLMKPRCLKLKIKNLHYYFNAIQILDFKYVHFCSLNTCFVYDKVENIKPLSHSPVECRHRRWINVGLTLDQS